MNKLNFNVKLDTGTIQVARLALLSADTETRGRGALHALKTASALAGTVSMTGDEAGVLQTALNRYTETEVREGSDAYKIATQFSAALGDFVCTTHVIESDPVFQKRAGLLPRVKKKTVDGDFLTANEEFERRMNAKRDATFREIFGRPEEMSIWGTPKLPEEPAAKRTPANRVCHLDGVVNTVLGGAAFQHAPTTRTRLSPKADTETDQLLTGGTVPTHNEQMKREGTETLMVNKNRGVSDQGPIVGSVSSYQRKLQEARDSGNTTAEVNLLSAMWD